MEIDALLCERVTQHDGLLFILGGGVTRIRRSLPGHLALDLAVQLMLSPDELSRPHTLVVSLQSPDEQTVGAVHVELETGSTIAPPLEQTSAAIPVPLGGMPIRLPGRYRIEAAIQGGPSRSYYLIVEDPTAQTAPANQPDR